MYIYVYVNVKTIDLLLFISLNGLQSQCQAKIYHERHKQTKMIIVEAIKQKTRNNIFKSYNNSEKYSRSHHRRFFSFSGYYFVIDFNLFIRCKLYLFNFFFVEFNCKWTQSYGKTKRKYHVANETKKRKK